jgi:hypothetical protein
VAFFERPAAAPAVPAPGRARHATSARRRALKPRRDLLRCDHPMSFVSRRGQSRTRRPPHVGIAFHHAPALWVGTTAIAIGVVLRLVGMR